MQAVEGTIGEATIASVPLEGPRGETAAEVEADSRMDWVRPALLISLLMARVGDADSPFQTNTESIWTRSSTTWETMPRHGYSPPTRLGEMPQSSFLEDQCASRVSRR